MKLYRALSAKDAYNVLARDGWAEGPHPDHPDNPKRGVVLYALPPLAASPPPEVNTILEVEFRQHDDLNAFLWDEDDEDQGYMLPRLFVEGWGQTKALSLRQLRAAIRRIVTTYRRELWLLGVKPREASERAKALEAVFGRWVGAEVVYNGLALSQIRA